MKKEIVYFDNGATSYPKPPGVIPSIIHSIRYHGGNAQRSGHFLSMAASRDMYRFRERAAELFSISHPENVIGVFNATYGLNLALKGAVRHCSTLYMSDMEHNAVRRPVASLERERNIKVKQFHVHPSEEETLTELVSMCEEEKPDVIVSIHCSNICPRKVPVEKIGKYCREKGIIFIVDGAQSGGHLKIDFDRSCIDALSLSGHKGLMGPSGTGILLLSSKLAGKLENSPTIIEGGSGSDSSSLEMPKVMPERLEAGTMPSYLYAGLTASMEFIRDIGFEYIENRERMLYKYLLEALSLNKRVRVYDGDLPSGSVVSFNIDGMTPSRVSEELDKRGICIRSGLHCAPLAHRTLGTFDSGGTARISLGIFNDKRQIERLYFALKDITSGI